MTMKQNQHQWVLFASPRNGRISIEACESCGIARGFVKGAHECIPVSEEVKQVRLRGWTIRPISSKPYKHTMTSSAA